MIERIIVQGYRIFEDLDMIPHPSVNILVGDNEAGKSTLLEALSLALTGRLGGRWAQDELNPFWFNRDIVSTFFASLETPNPKPAPQILIELFLSSENDELQPLRGMYNSQQKECPGVKMTVSLNQDYAIEFAEYLAKSKESLILPTEYYSVDWRHFGDLPIARKPKGIGVSVIDSRTVRSASGVDYYTRQMLANFIEPNERAEISVAHRVARHEMTVQSLGEPNRRIAEQGDAIHDRVLGLQMDQSSNSSWEAGIVPHVSDIPLAMCGQGQQAAVKIALAMHRENSKTSHVLVEEPENHLSHTSLMKLVSRIERMAGARQVFLTTHSSYVLNRLGLDRLALVHNGRVANFSALSDSTVKYFKKLSGFDTLRLVLAQSVVLVEGPSDEIIFERAFKDIEGQLPSERGIDVISMQGVALSRSLQICSVLDRKAAALRDNDGKPATHWEAKVKSYLSPVRKMFIGDSKLGFTLEPQFAQVNDEGVLRSALSCPDEETPVQWMGKNKTEAALRISESEENFSYPQYIVDAIKFLR